jgi:hypothetical protein
MMNRDDSEAKRTIPIVLEALRKFLRPSISGNVMYKGFVFAETTDLLDRLVLMESSEVQLTVIHIAANLAKYHPNGAHAQKTGRYSEHIDNTDRRTGLLTVAVSQERVMQSRME